MSGAGSSPQHVEIGTRRVRLTNLDKVLYPADGTTKAEVVRWYADAAPALAPYACDRPVTRKRWPDGVAAASFFEKNLAGRHARVDRAGHAPPHRPRHHLPADPRRTDGCARDPRVVRPVRRARAARAAVARGRRRAAAARPGRDRPRPRAWCRARRVQHRGAGDPRPHAGRRPGGGPRHERVEGHAALRRPAREPHRGGLDRDHLGVRQASSPRGSRATCPTWSCGA